MVRCDATKAGQSEDARLSEGKCSGRGLDRRKGRMTGLEGQTLERKAASGSGYQMFRVAGYVSRAEGLDSTD